MKIPIKTRILVDVTEELQWPEEYRYARLFVDRDDCLLQLFTDDDAERPDFSEFFFDFDGRSKTRYTYR